MLLARADEVIVTIRRRRIRPSHLNRCRHIPPSPRKSKVPAQSPPPSEHEAIWDKALSEGTKELLAEREPKAKAYMR
jgi:hypothetical protein